MLTGFNKSKKFLSRPLLHYTPSVILSGINISRESLNVKVVVSKQAVCLSSIQLFLPSEIEMLIDEAKLCLIDSGLLTTHHNESEDEKSSEYDDVIESTLGTSLELIGGSGLHATRTINDASKRVKTLQVFKQEHNDKHRSKPIMIVDALGRPTVTLKKDTCFTLKIVFKEAVNLNEVQQNIIVKEISRYDDSTTSAMELRSNFLHKQSVPLEEKTDELSATRFVTPMLSTTRLNYVFTSPLPLSVSAKNPPPLVLRIGADDISASLKNIQLQLPIQGPDAIATAANIDTVTITPPNMATLFSAPTFNQASGIVTVFPKDNSAGTTIKSGEFFEINIPIKCVNSQAGVCKISIKEVSNDLDGQQELRQTQLFINKFPQGFSLSHFQANPEKIYGGQQVALSWHALIQNNLKILLYLASSESNELTDVTDIGNREGNDKKIVRPTTEEGEVIYILMAVLMDEHNQPWLQQNFSLRNQVQVLKPVITNLITDSNGVIPPNAEATLDESKKIVAGSTVTLNWGKEGIFDSYELTSNDGRKTPLEGTLISCSDTPPCSITYQLSGYLKQYPGVIQSKKSVDVDLYHPDYTYYSKTTSSPVALLQNQGFPFIQVLQNQDGSTTLFAANEQFLQMFTVPVAQMQATMIGKQFFLQNGITAMALASTGKLYLANRTAPNLLVINASNNSLIATINLPMFPETLLLSTDGSQIYVAGNSNVVSISAASHNTLPPLLISAPQHAIKRISALALSNDNSRLYVASIDADVITVIDAVAMTIISTNSILLPQTSSAPSLKPRSLAMASSGDNRLFIALAGNSMIVSMDTTQMTHAAIIIDNTRCQNPEALLMAGKDKSLLWITTGFKNSILVYDIKKNNFTSPPIPVGLNTNYLTQTSDGINVWVVCSQGVYSFWTQEEQVLYESPLNISTKPNNVPNAQQKNESKTSSSDSIDTDKIEPIFSLKNTLGEEISSTPLAFFVPMLGKTEYLVDSKEPVSFGFFFPQFISPKPTISKQDVVTLQKHLSTSTTCCLPKRETPATLRQKEDQKTFEIEMHKKCLEGERKFQQRVEEAGKILEKIVLAGVLVAVSIGHRTKGSSIITVMAKEAASAIELKNELNLLTNLPVETTSQQPKNS